MAEGRRVIDCRWRSNYHAWARVRKDGYVRIDGRRGCRWYGRLGGVGTFGADVAGYAIDQVFGGIWERPGLDRRARSLVTMAVMVAMRQPNEFSIHMNIALNIGIELKEIEEALIQILPYVGYPAVATALVAASAVIRDRGLDTKPDYSGHRGLL